MCFLKLLGIFLLFVIFFPNMSVANPNNIKFILKNQIKFRTHWKIFGLLFIYVRMYLFIHSFVLFILFLFIKLIIFYLL